MQSWLHKAYTKHYVVQNNNSGMRELEVKKLVGNQTQDLWYYCNSLHVFYCIVVVSMYFIV